MLPRRLPFHICRRFNSTVTPDVSLTLSYLGAPSWSVSSLLPPSSTPTDTTITPAKLHHLLRLSALSPPSTLAAETSLLNSLHNHLHFVRAVQEVDTTDVPPLSRIEDEVSREEITWKAVNARGKKAYDREWRLGEQGDVEWDPMSLPKKKVGGFYVVDEKVTDELDVENEGIPVGKV
ncbi:hypothetical protein K440DRAFT_658222 [Wilcoxina mikolae CBS 423.85]|nr:hypothetical protein K440DRAFT_658222 [Wilcoxina mikolae CBS 423.85]